MDIDFNRCFPEKENGPQAGEKMRRSISAWEMWTESTGDIASLPSGRLPPRKQEIRVSVWTWGPWHLHAGLVGCRVVWPPCTADQHFLEKSHAELPSVPATLPLERWEHTCAHRIPCTVSTNPNSQMSGKQNVAYPDRGMLFSMNTKLQITHGHCIVH